MLLSPVEPTNNLFQDDLTIQLGTSNWIEMKDSFVSYNNLADTIEKYVGICSSLPSCSKIISKHLQLLMVAIVATPYTP